MPIEPTEARSSPLLFAVVRVGAAAWFRSEAKGEGYRSESRPVVGHLHYIIWKQLLMTMPGRPACLDTSVLVLVQSHGALSPQKPMQNTRSSTVRKPGNSYEYVFKRRLSKLEWASAETTLCGFYCY